jgi:hypothetical protein
VFVENNGHTKIAQAMLPILYIDPRYHTLEGSIQLAKRLTYNAMSPNGVRHGCLKRLSELRDFTHSVRLEMNLQWPHDRWIPSSSQNSPMTRKRT